MTEQSSSGTAASRHDRLRAWMQWSFAYAATVLLLFSVLRLVSSPVRPQLIEDMAYLAYFGTSATWLVGFVIALIVGHSRISIRRVVLWMAMPALVIACIALIANEVPASVRFDLSRPALERAAARAQAGEQVAPGEIGLIPVSGLKVIPGGTTLFFVSDASGLTFDCGYAYNPRQKPDVTAEPNDSLSESPLANGWWVFCENL